MKKIAVHWKNLIPIQFMKNGLDIFVVDSCKNGGLCKLTASNCNQYYELVLQSCPSRESFSSTEMKCTSEISCSTNVDDTTDTTFTQSSPLNDDEDCGCTPPVVCTGTDKYPSQNCNQYYECVESNGGYALVVQTCPPGQAFNRMRLLCVVDEACGTGNSLEASTTQKASKILNKFSYYEIQKY